MNDRELSELLRNVASGAVSIEAAGQAISSANTGFVDLGDVKLDTDRRRRRGVPEAVFCQGKTREQVLEIASRLDAAGQSVICTRVTPETAEFVRASRPDFEYFEKARVLGKSHDAGGTGAGYIAVVSAGTTDIPVAEEAAVCLELWGNEVRRIYDVGVAGLQRLLAQLDTLQGASVAIAVAGMEGALPSVLAGLISAPLIAVPTSVGYGANLGGIAALLSMLNSCSGGIATVNIDNGFGAGLLAHMINHVGVAKPNTSGGAAQ